MTILQMMLASGGGAVPLEFIAAAAGTGNNMSVSITYPAGIQAGDLLVVVGSSKRSGSNFAMDSAGYTVLDSLNWFYLGVKIAAGTESGTTIGSTTQQDQCGAVVFVLRGAASALIDWDAIETDGADAPSSDATAAGQIHLVGATGNEDGLVVPSGYTLAASSSGEGHALGAYKVLTASGATGIQEVTTGTNATGAWSIIVGPA